MITHLTRAWAWISRQNYDVDKSYTIGGARFLCVRNIHWVYVVPNEVIFIG